LKTLGLGVNRCFSTGLSTAYDEVVTGYEVKRLAAECGFELAGVARAERLQADAERYLDWVERGLAGAMGYLTDRRAIIRTDPRLLLASARSIVSVGKLYSGPEPYSTDWTDAEAGWISRYAWGEDYHDVVRRGLEQLVELLGPGHEWKICVDTAPLLERSYAREAGLGWIGKNTCLINQELGSWFFLGEILTSLEIEPDSPPPDRCGTCTRCIDACPTQAISPGGYGVDARRCISYFTIELRGSVPLEMREGIGQHVFGCDICQDVCPWNREARVSQEPAFTARHFAPSLESLVALSEDDFREAFRASPVLRAKYAGFLRNVAIAIGNTGRARFLEPLEKLARFPDELVAEPARWAMERIASRG
jgi:epoxyqueuosine reductase